MGSVGSAHNIDSHTATSHNVWSIVGGYLTTHNVPRIVGSFVGSFVGSAVAVCG